MKNLAASIRQRIRQYFKCPRRIFEDIPPKSVVAEKLQALVFLGSVNSRMKDFYDLWVLAERFEFDGRKLQQAIINTFKRRNTALPRETPVGLSESFAVENQAQWQAFIKRTYLEAVPISFSDVSPVLNSFLMPPLRTSAYENIQWCVEAWGHVDILGRGLWFKDEKKRDAGERGWTPINPKSSCWSTFPG